MAAWTKERKLDCLMEIIQEHQPDGRSGFCACHANVDSSYWTHLREQIANEGLLDDDPGAVR